MFKEIKLLSMEDQDVSEVRGIPERGFAAKMPTIILTRVQTKAAHQTALLSRQD